MFLVSDIVLVAMNSESRSNKRRETRKKQNKEALQRMRNRIKNDPKRYEEMKRKDRERKKRARAEGKIKKVADMNEQELRAIRQAWRESKRRKSLRNLKQKKLQ